MKPNILQFIIDKELFNKYYFKESISKNQLDYQLVNVSFKKYL